jgi:hypothetical protein
MKNLLTLLFFSLILLLDACKTTILTVEDVIPTINLESVNPFFKQTKDGQIHTGLILTTRFRNPYNKPFEIPSYSIGLVVKTKKQQSFNSTIKTGKPNDNYQILLEKEIKLSDNNMSIPPKAIKLTVDTLVFGTEDLNVIMGYENIFELKSEIEIDLSKYITLLPDYEIMVTEDFKSNTSRFKSILEKTARKKLGKYRYVLSKSVMVKVPRLPKVTFAEGIPVKIIWMGDNFTFINPNDIKDKLEGFIDALLTQEFSGLARGFVDSLETIKIPFTNMVLKDKIFDMAQVFFQDIRNQYDDMKQILPKNGDKISDFMVKHYMADQTQNWNKFKNNWETFKNIEIPDGIPSSETVGFKIIFPVKMINTNNFEITVPCFKNSVEVDNREVLSIQLRSGSFENIDLNSNLKENIVLSGNESTTLYLSFSLNWNNSASGIYSFLSGESQRGNMKGLIGFDFGYGPMYLRYDLDNINVNFSH